MTLTNLQKAPFPWFGGKRDAAVAVWKLLGDVEHYVEPFAGSMAVLLERPHLANRPYHSETVNDLDGLLVNAWRSIQLKPQETAEAASWPVAEADLHARHLAVVRWRESRDVERLMADPLFCDPVIAGWWIWGVCSWIGGGFASGTGPWTEIGGRLVKQTAKKGAREPGVTRGIPHLGNDGRGVNRPQAREPGVKRQIPHLGSNGMGVNTASAREPGVGEPEYHPVTMPELRRWFGYLTARLRHVRILNGPWNRAATMAAVKTLGVRTGDGIAGVFLDPPYGDVRASDIYAKDSLTVAGDVQKWCIENGDDEKLRIVLAGYGDEHSTLVEHGWSEIQWFKGGYIKGGYGTEAHQERLWASPHCLVDDPRQASLF